jgi:predicted lipoprotein with Yx(FWY)xxD motif
MRSQYHPYIQRIKLLGVGLILSALVLSACQAAPASPVVTTSNPPAASATTTPILPATGPTAAPPTAEPTMAPTAAPASGPSISVATDPEYGQILVGDGGFTLYMFTKDEPDKSNCNASCLEKWPPLQTHGSPKLGSGVDASLIGTTTLADGTQIVTYNHMPLYYWYHDAKAGDTNGQGVGEVWFLVSPAGQPVKEESSTPAAASGAPAAAAGPSIGVASDAKHGQFLVGDNGKTLYVFTKDGPDQSNCSGACAQKWPPLLTQGAPALGSGVDASMIGTATLADGTKIVTYNHMPLYYWYQDAKPGDTNGEGVGQVWFMLSPTGKMIQLPVVQPAPTKKPKTGGMGGKNY